MSKPSNGRSIIATLCSHILLILCCTGMYYSLATFTYPSQQSSPQNLPWEIDRFIQSAMTRCLSSTLSVSVVKDGQVILSKGYGHTSVNKTKEVTSKTKFAIGSLTKAFTALLIAKIVKESENITFDTPIKQFLPYFRLVDDYRSEHASLRDLLGHRMAIPDNTLALILGMDTKVSRKELSSNIQYLKTPYSFREKAIYSNYMYLFAGDILERMSQGRSWESLVRESIFKPLGMTQSGFVDLVKDFSDDFALPCDLLNGSLVDIDPAVFEIGKIAGPAGSIYSTADDMAKWMMFLLSKGKPITNTSRLDIDSSMVDATFQPSIYFDYFPNLYKPRNPVSHQHIVYCMGWITSMYREFRNIFHTGQIITHTTYLWLFPDVNLGIYVATNGEQSRLPESLPYYISDLLLGLPTWINSSDVCDPLDKNETAPQPDLEEFSCTATTQCNLSDYVGVYVHEVLGKVSISLFNDAEMDNGEPQKLNFTYGHLGLMELTPRSRASFTGTIYGPLSFRNPGSDVFVVDFSFRKGRLDDCKKDEHGVVASLQVALSTETMGPFVKQDV